MSKKSANTQNSSCLISLLKIYGILVLFSLLFAFGWLIGIIWLVFFRKKMADNPKKQKTWTIVVSILSSISFILFAVFLGTAATSQDNNTTPDSTTVIEQEATAQTPTPQPIATSAPTATPIVVTPAPSDETLSYDMEVHFLDVGQGLSILVKSDDETLIYDGGNRSYSSFVVAYLKEQEIETIDYLISSHYDEDHMSGLVGCLNAFTVKNVIGPDYIQDSNLYDSFMEKVSDQGLEVLHPDVGTEYTIGSATFTILAPSTITESESNNNSVVIKLVNGNNSFIFTGDAEQSSEQTMIASDIDLDCDVLCVGHHGSANSTTQNFLDSITPEYSVISCGADNIYMHPDAETMERLKNIETKLYRTDEQGTIIAKSDGKIITWNCEPSESWQAGKPTPTPAPTPAPTPIETATPVPTPVLTESPISETTPVPEAQEPTPNTSANVSGSYAVNGNNGKIHIVGACTATGNGDNAMKHPVYFNTYEEAESHSISIAPTLSKRQCGNCW